MNIESIKRRLLVKYPLFGSVVANSNFINDSSVGAAGTDGKNIYYNPNFVESITDEEQTFIFAHEICHIAFDHINRCEGKDKKIWNIATDSVVNAFLKQDGLPMVEGGVDIPEAINYDAEEMYKKLLEEKKQQQQQSSGSGQSGDDQQQSQSQQQSSSDGESSQEQDKQSQGQSGGGSSEDSQEEKKQQDVGHDTHSMWDKVVEKKHQEEQSQSDLGQSGGKDENKQSLLDKLSKIFDKKKEQQRGQPDEVQNKEQEKKKNEGIKKLAELGERETFKQNKIERKRQLEELRKSLASRAHGYGSTTNSEIRNITNIGTSAPLIDWRRLLKEAVKYDIDWSYQNAGIEDGVVTAYLEEIPKPETEIVLDTSGSIDETLLRNFLRECKNILQNSKVKVGCFDTKFYGFTEIKNVSDIDNLPFYGGGGTNFDAAVNAFTRRVENKIIFTDGDANMPSTQVDAIWIVFGGIKINPKGGKVIYIDDAQLERLCSYEIVNETKGKTKR